MVTNLELMKPVFEETFSSLMIKIKAGKLTPCSILVQKLQQNLSQSTAKMLNTVLYVLQINVLASGVLTKTLIIYLLSSTRAT